MRAWPSPDLPALDPSTAASAVRVYDEASGGLQATTPGEAGARMYVCGITPYDATHLGHAATFLAFDLLNRAWRDAGHAVSYVQNVTDVDDPLLERAEATGEPWQQLAERETQLLRDDMEALRVLPPESFVGAVESVPLVVDLVQRLRERGAVYDVDGDLYFAVRSDPRFGQVSHLDEQTMVRLFAERGGDPDRPGKKDPLDCLLWRAARPGEPSWDTDLGPGRPGWHVECASIALEYLGAGFDVQGGGSDLVFPHHEMSASEAQSALDGTPFARAYVYAGMVGLDGEKMSKSKGNLVLVSTLREAGHEPMAIRLALLAHHYRSDWEWTGADLASAEQRLDRWASSLGRADAEQARALRTSVRTVLADDLDAPAALAAVDACAEAAAVGDGSGAASVRETVDALLGVVW
ncbi:MAG TPA: cysteine--1-D-myo-inosityl 2-amino-2-deoxy-alpha-D-glucopyranoside ligase [Nocardioidaceae bacterium]|nr:cysteine--1-D-myo-inosityl 2-amino-2-deoxy-alpha-D-glucopyranoside ligase [Nocardioidaceae bacterium]